MGPLSTACTTGIAAFAVPAAVPAAAITAAVPVAIAVDVAVIAAVDVAVDVAVTFVVDVAIAILPCTVRSLQNAPREATVCPPAPCARLYAVRRQPRVASDHLPRRAPRDRC
eukprot:77716-Chlamydomonas_euryale.AAC.1